MALSWSLLLRGMVPVPNPSAISAANIINRSQNIVQRHPLFFFFLRLLCSMFHSFRLKSFAHLCFPLNILIPTESFRGLLMPTPNTPLADTPDKGELQVNITSEITALPIADAKVSISYTGVPESQLEELTTDSSGQTETIELDAPPLEYSLNPDNEIQPYSEYTLNVTAPGYEPVSIAGAEILPTIKALQNIQMRPAAPDESSEDVFVIPAHTLYGTYPPKIPEDEIKPVNETGEIVLSRVVIPEYIVVHNGSPRDSTARDYYVKYKDYIKNVASSEIYATWPADTIRANVLAIMSFTLNRVYTEWYRNKGYDFTITSSTAFDHKWIPERNIYDTISVIVDELFPNYLSRPNVRQPILTQYCDGRQVQCPNWMTFLL